MWAKGRSVNDAGGQPGPRLQIGVLYWAESPWQDAKCGIADPPGPAGFGTNPCLNVSLTEEWKLYTLDVGVPAEKVATSTGASWVYWELVGAGVAWLDLVQLVPTTTDGMSAPGADGAALRS